MSWAHYVRGQEPHGDGHEVCSRGPSHIAMTSGSRRDSFIQRAAESLRGSERAERLGTALADLARELADARRQIAALKRENAALRAQLGAEGVAPHSAPPPNRLAPPPNRLQPRVGIGGSRRG
jgi:hypothetical protein